jgi:hypothetical protein
LNNREKKNNNEINNPTLTPQKKRRGAKVGHPHVRTIPELPRYS